MSEHELREGLKLAVAEEPPMTFDLDELVITAERLVRRRRALVTVGVSTAAVAVAAVTVPVVLGVGAPAELPHAAPPQPTVSAPSTPAKAPGLTVAQLTQRGRELQTHLRAQFPLVVPDARNVEPRPFGGEAEGQFWDGQTYLEGVVQFKLGDVQTAATVHIQTGQDGDGCTTACQDLPQPDGSKVVIRTERGPAGDSPEMLITSATHYRKDGTLIRIATYNYDPVNGQPGMYQQSVALTLSQLVRLATDPALHM